MRALLHASKYKSKSSSCSPITNSEVSQSSPSAFAKLKKCGGSCKRVYSIQIALNDYMTSRK